MNEHCGDIRRSDELASRRQRVASRNKRALLYALAFVLDLTAIILGYLMALAIRPERWLEAGGQPIVLIALPVFVLIAIAREVHSVETLQDRALGAKRSLGALGATALVVMGLSFMVDADDISRVGFFLTFFGAALFMVIGKLLVDLIFRVLMGGRALTTIVLKDGLDVALEDRDDYLVDVGALALWPDPDHPAMIDELSRIVAPFDRVIIACRFDRREVWSTFLKGHDVGGEIVLDRSLLHGAVAIGQFDGHETLVVSLGPLNFFNRLQKRLFDLIAASAAMIALAPLFAIIAVAIKLDSPGPVFFRQLRVGQGNRQFRIFKFRSMRSEKSDVSGSQSTSREDHRITRVGRLIRRTSIDELPQLINVLKGEMSMVGPRPHALGSRAGNRLFWQASEAYWMRHALKPGLTGLAQIRGYRGATDTEDDLQMRVRCDLEYLSNWSLWTDVKIMLKTLPVLVHKNAY